MKGLILVAGAAVAAVGVALTASAAVVTDPVTVPAWVAGVGMAVGGLGMGLSMASNAVLLFDLSPPEDRGANSAAIQMSDSLGGLLVIGAAGVVYALWRQALAPTQLFAAVFSLSLVVAVLASLVAARVRPVEG